MSTGTESNATPDGADLAARVGASLWQLEVVGAFDVVPGMRRIRLTAPGLDALAPQAGQDLMLAVPTDTELRRRRRYTIRHFVPAENAVDIDIVVHGDGPGARWAAAVGAGDAVEAIGPRGKVVLRDDADWHLFAADDSGIPAKLAMIEALPPGSTAIALFEVAAAPNEPPVDVPAGAAVDIRWLHRGSAEPGRVEFLLDALRDASLPAGRGHAYLAGEFAVVAALRAELMAKGLDAEQVSPKSYWRRGVANAAHGEPPRD